MIITATISSTMRLNDSISGTMRSITTAMRSTLTAMRSIQGVHLGPEFARAAADITLAEQSLVRMDDEMLRFANTARSGSDGFTVMKGIAVNAFIAIGNAAKNAVSDVIGLVDSTTTQAARLSMVNDGLQTQAELQDSIFAAAQRSRSAYGEMMDSVAKLNLLAGDAFSTNKEAVAYAELLAKSFKIAGTDTAAQTGATRQLIQALGSGVLRGDELNSVFEAAPNLIRNIADYMDVPIGKIRDMAVDGELTADIVKAAMFASADDINEKFAQMPMTIGEIGTSVKNVLLKTFTPSLQAIGEGARWIYDNWETVAPVFVGVATAVAALAIGWGVYTVATWLAVAANRALMVSFLTNPITLIAVAIGVIIGLIYNWVQSVGGLEIAWAIVVDRVRYGWDVLKIGFFTGVFWVQDMMDKMGLGMLKSGVAIVGFMGDMKVSVLTILQNMVNGAIDIINGFIGTINNIPGVSISAIEHATFAATAAAENEAQRQAGASVVARREAEVSAAAAERQSSLAAMKEDAVLATEKRQADILEKQLAAQEAAGADGGMEDMFGDYSTSAAGGKALKTKNVDKLITEEDIKLLTDIATRDYQLQYQQLTPSVSVNWYGDNRTGQTADEIVDQIAYSLEEITDAYTGATVNYG